MLIAIVLSFILNYSFVSGNEETGVSMAEYHTLPKLYIYDPYDECMAENHKYGRPVYCLADVIIKPNSSSKLWSLIEKLTNDTKQNFRHDHLHRGICIQRCRDLLDKFNRETQMSYYQEKFNGMIEAPYDFGDLENGIDHRNKFNKIINQCVNLQLKEQYEFMAYSRVEYCIYKDEIFEIDDLDWFFLVVLFLIGFLTAVSTAYDILLRKNCQDCRSDKDYYSKPLKTTKQMLLVSFSIPRNNYRIMFKEGTSEESKNLRPINAIRFLTCFCVIIGHGILFFSIFPQLNPEYLEQNYNRFITALLRNGVTVIQTYIFLSGFLLMIQFSEFFSEKKTFGIKNFIGIAIYRYMRLIPVYGFIMLFDATWLIRVQDGPVWKRVSETERVYCRNNWWTNLLFINNYVKASEPCVQQGWYLATDFQLFIFGLIFLAILKKFPQSKNFLFILGVFISTMIPAIVVYVNKFEGVFVVSPEAQKYAMWHDDMYLKYYIPTHTNMGCYILGLITGFYYKLIKQHYIDINSHKIFRFFFYLVVPFGTLMILMGHIFYKYDYEKPAFWIAMYGTLSRNLWGVFASIFIIGITNGLGCFVRDVFNSAAFRPLGRISYSIFLCHVTMIRMTMGNSRAPIYISDVSILQTVSSVCFLSCITGYLLSLFIEFPVTALQSCLFNFTRKSFSIDSKDVEMNLTKNNPNMNDGDTTDK